MKAFAVGSKILAGVIWVGIALLKISRVLTSHYTSVPPRHGTLMGWGTPSYYYWIALKILLLVVLASLAVVPNRWLVSSRKAFGMALFTALFPFGVVVVYDWLAYPFNSVWAFFTPAALMNATLTFGPLPVSLALSFWRQQRGIKSGMPDVQALQRGLIAIHFLCGPIRRALVDRRSHDTTAHALAFWSHTQCTGLYSGHLVETTEGAFPLDAELGRFPDWYRRGRSGRHALVRHYPLA